MKWNKEECIKVALLFENRGEFEKKYRGAYMAARKNNWLDYICLHMNYVNKKWCESDCHKESLKYNNRSELCKFNSSVYKKIIKNGWNYMFSHMNKDYVNDNRCIYVYEFSDNHVYVGLTKDLDRRNIQHMSKGSVFNYIKISKCDYKLVKLTDYINIFDAIKMEIEYVDNYQRMGWDILNMKKAGGIGSCGDLGKIPYWTKERCQEESIKYQSRTEFKKKSQSAYQSALRNNWLTDICHHMPLIIKPKGYWTKERCQEEASKYKNRNKFYENNKSAYSTSLKNGWLDMFFIKNMKI